MEHCSIDVHNLVKREVKFKDAPTSYEDRNKFENLLDGSWLSDDEYEELFDANVLFYEGLTGLMCSVNTDLSGVTAADLSTCRDF